MISLPDTGSDDALTHTPGSDQGTFVLVQDDEQESCPQGSGINHPLEDAGEKPPLHRGRDPVEDPKPIWTKSRNRAFRHFLIMHFVPVATTLVLFWLYLKGLQWKANDAQLKMLLFAAKLHESLIVISLADIIFHRIRYHLLSGRGVSFGLLTSPFRVSNPLSLVQTPFLASATFTLKSGPELLTVLLVVLVSVLALLAGPSSAALMLPKYDWWQVPNDQDVAMKFKEQDLEDATYIGASFDDLFPLQIDGWFGPNQLRDSRLEQSSLPARLEQLISGLDRFLSDSSAGANSNVTVVDGATVDSFGLAYQEERFHECEVMNCEYISRTQNMTVAEVKESGIDCIEIPCKSVTVQATSPLALVTQKLFDRFRTWISASSSMIMIMAQAIDSKTRRLTWRQPTVSMQCSAIAYESGSSVRPILFQNLGSIPQFSISPDIPLLRQIMLAGNRGYATYVDITHLIPAGVTVSTALLIDGGLDQPKNMTHLCLVDARWIESNVWFTAPYGTILRSGISMKTLQATTGSNATETFSPVINIATEYGNSLDANPTFASSSIDQLDGTDASTPFDLIQRRCSMTVADALRPKCLILAHTLYLTDSLRRAQSSFNYYTAKQIHESHTMLLQTDPWTTLDYRLYQQLHAYKFEGSLIRLSMSVLLVHMMLVYAHLLLLVAGDGWCSRAWSEMGELMALAMLTRPSPLLRNAGGGIKSWQTWKLRAFVREVTPDGTLEFVLKETVNSPRVLADLEEAQEKVLVEPEADRRYG